ncbi:hypothetical protein [Paenibacillus pseudetheri]|uniref:HEAT repeat domain-containing protein n=1 Tax=Paenibacillus pseudetheri TaxID=2897682 RepID=A0ABN8FL92_9BACL|nr:hypothetical protein [Paenibacillus pseudetheri]CAH1056011.1 hypothetical protein PAECIP111894_02164 [Paenibacillus pseudetheri]
MAGQKMTIMLFQQWVSDKEQWVQLRNLLMKESNLPGPRVNLELSGNFAKHFAHPKLTETDWEFLNSWANLTEAEAGVNDPREFLPFCAVRALGAYYSYAKEDQQVMIQSIIKTAMNDSRWRMREASAMALQSIGEDGFALVRQLIDMWEEGANGFEQRAFVAALAHPPLLKKKENTLYCLQLATRIMESMGSGEVQYEDAEHFRVLSKGLEYSLSVFMASEPEAGFAMLEKFAKSPDNRIIKIVKSNLGKSRLSKKYALQVAEILKSLTIQERT